MDPGLRGKKALITGGGRGIGRALGLALAEAGVDVAIASRDPSAETIRDIESHGVKALRLVADVSQEAQVVRMVNEALDGLGGLDLYINNAAAHWDEPVTRVTSEGWFNSINTNLSACVWGCREVCKHFLAQGRGAVLIVGSAATWSPLYKETGYRASKAGLKAYMEVLAVELAPFGIRVNMLTPGYFPTGASAHLAGKRLRRVLDNIPLRRAGNLEDLVAPALLLLSDQLGAFITGTELVVDGGQTLRPLAFYSDDEVRAMNAVEGPGQSETRPAQKRRVVDVRRVVPFSPEGAEGLYASRLLVDGESVGSKNLVMNHFTLNPGQRTYRGSHPPPYDEVYYILRGRGILTLSEPEDVTYEMAADTVAYIPGGTPHQIENVGKGALEMLTIMPFLPGPGANALYDERKRKWGTSFMEESR